MNGIKIIKLGADFRFLVKTGTLLEFNNFECVGLLAALFTRN